MIGDKININGVDLLVLNEVANEIFVWAYDTGIRTAFDDKSTDYSKSLLRSRTELWLNETNIYVSSYRTIDLTALNGNKKYGWLEVSAAPLTLDEYRKYYEIIQPNIKESFWLSTSFDASDSSLVCLIYTNGTAIYNTYSNSYGLAPAFWISKDYLKKENPFDKFSTAEIAEELARRIREGL